MKKEMETTRMHNDQLLDLGQELKGELGALQKHAHLLGAQHQDL